MERQQLEQFPFPLGVQRAIVAAGLNSASLAQAYVNGWVQVAPLDVDALHSLAP